MRRALVASFELVGALIACGGSGSGQTQPLSPISFGRFDVVTWEAKPLPDTLRVIAGASSTPGTGSVTCPEILLGATLDIATDGTITRTSRLAYPCTGTLPRPGDLPDSLTKVENGHVLITGTSVVLSFSEGTASAPSETIEYARTQGTDLVVYQILTGPTPGTTETLANARVYRHE